MWHATKRKARPYGKPSVDPELGIDLIREQICAAEKLRQSELITGYHVDDWDNTTLNYVEKAFGPNHRNLQVFQNATATEPVILHEQANKGRTIIERNRHGG